MRGRIEIHKDDVRPYLFDFAPGDFAVVVFAEQAPHFIIVGNNQGLNTAAFRIENEIGDTAHPFAVFDIDDIFFP